MNPISNPDPYCPHCLGTAMRAVETVTKWKGSDFHGVAMVHCECHAAPCAARQPVWTSEVMVKFSEQLRELTEDLEKPLRDYKAARAYEQARNAS